MRFINFILICFLSSEAFSDDGVKEIGNFDDWTAYYWDLKDGKVCAIISSPLKEEGRYTRRGKVYSQVSLNEGNSGNGVVSFQAGYIYKNDSEVNVNIDKKNKLVLFPIDRVAWTISPEEDRQLINFMKLGNEMIVRGISSRGTNTKDTYSLRGFSAALKSITKECK